MDFIQSGVIKDTKIIVRSDIYFVINSVLNLLSRLYPLFRLLMKIQLLLQKPGPTQDYRYSRRSFKQTYSWFIGIFSRTRIIINKCTELYCTVPYCTLYCTVQYRTVQYIVLLYCTLYSVLYSTVLYCTMQH